MEALAVALVPGAKEIDIKNKVMEYVNKLQKYNESGRDGKSQLGC